MYDKIITPAFEQVGKRKHLTGYTGELYDGNILLHSQSYDTNSQAEQAMDRIVYDLLTDLAEHGLVDDVPAALEAEQVSSTHLPSWKPVACTTCGNDGDCPDCDALTTSIITTIVHQAMQATPTCKNCNQHHYTWRCPEIGDLLFAEPVVMVWDAVACQAPDCIQLATHIGQLCCYHYSEQIGVPCDCTDDDYEDAMWEGAHGSYNGWAA